MKSNISLYAVRDAAYDSVDINIDAYVSSELACAALLADLEYTCDNVFGIPHVEYSGEHQCVEFPERNLIFEVSYNKTGQINWFNFADFDGVSKYEGWVMAPDDIIVHETLHKIH